MWSKIFCAKLLKIWKRKWRREGRRQGNFWLFGTVRYCAGFYFYRTNFICLSWALYHLTNPTLTLLCGIVIRREEILNNLIFVLQFEFKYVLCCSLRGTLLMFLPHNTSVHFTPLSIYLFVPHSRSIVRNSLQPSPHHYITYISHSNNLPVTISHISHTLSHTLHIPPALLLMGWI